MAWRLLGYDNDRSPEETAGKKVQQPQDRNYRKDKIEKIISEICLNVKNVFSSIGRKRSIVNWRKLRMTVGIDGRDWHSICTCSIRSKVRLDQGETDNGEIRRGARPVYY